PNSRTIWVARAVAEARSSAAPVDASPRIRRSAARPPRRTARVSARYRSPYSRRSSAGSVSVSPRACPAPRTVTRLTGSACGDSVATRAWPASWTATVASSPGAGGPGAEQDAVAGTVEVGGDQGGPAGPDRGDGGLVDQVGQVRAGESGGGRGD